MPQTLLDNLLSQGPFVGLDSVYFMLKKIAALIEVRKIIALSITAVFIILAVLGRLEAKLV